MSQPVAVEDQARDAESQGSASAGAAKTRAISGAHSLAMRWTCSRCIASSATMTATRMRARSQARARLPSAASVVGPLTDTDRRDDVAVLVLST